MEKEKIGNPLTLRALILGTALSILASVLSSVVLGVSPTIATSQIMTNRLILTFPVLLILMLVSGFLGERGLSSGEMIIIYVMLLTSVLNNDYLQIISGPLYCLTGSPFASIIKPLMPDLWIPTDPSIINPMLTGGVPIPWSVWAIPLAYWIITTLSLLGFTLCLMLILSYRLIVVERMPFPTATASLLLIKDPKKPFTQKTGSNFIIIGIIIGFIIQSTYALLHEVFPVFPKFWPTGVWGSVGFDLGPIVGPGMYKDMMLLITLDTLPFTVAMFFLIPTKLLFSMLVAHVIFAVIVPNIEVTLGMLTNFGNFGLYDIVGLALSGFGTAFEPTGIQLCILAWTGIGVGVAIAFLVYSGKTIVASFKSAISGTKTGPFSSRLLWLGFASSIIIYFAMMEIVAIPPQIILLNIVLIILGIYLAVRLRGEAGAASGYQLNWQGMRGFSFHATGELPGPDVSAGAFRTSIMYGALTWKGLIFGVSGPTLTLMESIWLSELTESKWDWRKIAVACVISAIISMLIGLIIQLWGAYTYGIQVRWPSYWSIISDDQESFVIPQTFTSGALDAGFSNYRLWPEMTVGIIVGIVLTLFSFRFPWWPINPVGFTIGAGLVFQGFQWFQGLLALILRYLVLKIGGAELYEKKAVPLALGSIIGYALCQLLYAIVLILKI